MSDLIIDPNNPTPSQIVDSLLLRGTPQDAIRIIQQQLDGILGHLQISMAKVGNSLGAVNIRNMHQQLLVSMLIELLIETNVIPKDRFEELYSEKVVKVMEAHIESIKAAVADPKPTTETEDLPKAETKEEPVIIEPPQENNVVQFPSPEKAE